MMIQDSGLCLKIHMVHIFSVCIFFPVDMLLVFWHEGQRLFWHKLSVYHDQIRYH